jgi:hypothetical protein
MPNSEDYTIVWAGVYTKIDADNLENAQALAEPIVRAADQVGIEHWFDTFEIDEVSGDVYSVLLGRHLATLGYKEGITTWSMDRPMLSEELLRLEPLLRKAGFTDPAKVHVLLHIEQ